MKKSYKEILPLRFHEASYETDVPQVVKERAIEQIKKHEGLYLWGEPGVGKTHIACGLAKNLIESGFKVMFLNTSQFLEQLREEFALPNEDGGLFKEVMDFDGDGLGILILDDIGAEKSSDWTRERLSIIINKKYEDMLPIIFTSNCDLEILSARMGDRITSRIIGMTSVMKISGLDKRISQNK